MFHNKQKIISKPFYHLHTPSKQQGSSLVIAIFIIVVLSLLGASLVKMMASSQQNVAFEVLGTRAYTAAQTGVQWQLAQLFPVGLGSSPTKTCSDVSHVPPIINNTSGLTGCNIINPIGCNDFLHDGVRYYTVTSVGTCDIDGEVTSRIIEVEARSL